MAKILLVDDAPDVQALVRESLDPTFQLAVASSLDEAMRSVREQIFDLILLDIHLPDGDGFPVCTELRERRRLQTPVIFLTGADEIDDKLRAFAAGADDYVVKPFNARELKARIQSRLRSVEAAQPAQNLARGPLMFDLILQRVYVQDGEARRDLDLTPSEFKLLSFLARHPGEYFNRDQLLAKVWRSGVHVVQENIYTHVSSLRKKMGTHSSFLESIPKVGYRFAESSAKAEANAPSR